MSDDKTVRAPIVSPGRAALELVAHRLTAALRAEVAPQDRLDLVAYLVTYAVAETARTLPWNLVRERINEVLGGAVAAGLDVGLGLPGHAARVDALPPYTQTPQ